MEEKSVEEMQRIAAEFEIKYWELKIESARIDKEIHEKMAKYFEENLDKLVKMGLGINNIKVYEEIV